MFSVDYFLFLSLLAWSDWRLLVCSVCCIYVWGMGRWVTSFACWSLLVNRPGCFWARWSVLSRGERVAECKEKTSEERLVFLLWIGVGQSSAEWLFFIFSCPMVMSSGCRAFLPNGHLFYCPIYAESALCFCCPFVLLVGKYFVLLRSYLFITYWHIWFSWIISKNRKKGSRLQVQSAILFRVLVRNEEFSILFVHTRV